MFLRRLQRPRVRLSASPGGVRGELNLGLEGRYSACSRAKRLPRSPSVEALAKTRARRAWI